MSTRREKRIHVAALGGQKKDASRARRRADDTLTGGVYELKDNGRVRRCQSRGQRGGVSKR